MPSSSLNNALLENAVTDIFNGVTVNMVENECELSGSEFQDALGHALGQWRQNGNRGVWFYVPFSQAGTFLPALHAAGFQFHHCRPAYCVVNAWLDDTCESGLPHFANHQVGVGGMVINKHNEVLAIRERSGLTAKLKDFWKLPGGLVDRRESVCDAAVRECREETD
eukprot:INCI16163.2.p1 GENE.INCI16163.2~~INCI16163.2.p1  ORF type:complete len:167 (-),score=26.16 INCI16163.2:306-806(-)